MDKRYTLQDLSVALASRRGMERKDAEVVVRSVFEIVEQYLVRDKIVKVKGLGTFKIVAVEARESVNVNTGERIVIAGHGKVTFTPDATLRDQVNRPFADFMTTPLNDATSTEEMEKVAPGEPEDLTGSAGFIPATAPSEPEDLTGSAPSEPEDLTGSAGLNPATAPSASEDVTGGAGLRACAPAAEDTNEVEGAGPEACPPSHTPEDLTGSAGLNPATASSEPEDSTRAVSPPPPVNTDVDVVNHRKSPLPIILSAVVVILVAAVGYWLGTRQTAPPPPPVVKVAPRPKPAKKPVATPDSVLARQYPQVEKGKYYIVGIKEEYTVKDGEWLAKITEEKLGDPKLYFYIAAVNGLDPDDVRSGMTIKIPILKKKE